MLIKSELRKLRGERTQNEMAGILGIPQSVYSMAETGKVMLSSNALYTLCDAMEVNPQDVYPPNLLKAAYGLLPPKPTPKERTSISVKIPIDIATEIDSITNNRVAFVIAAIQEKLHG